MKDMHELINLLSKVNQTKMNLIKTSKPGCSPFIQDSDFGIRSSTQPATVVLALHNSKNTKQKERKIKGMKQNR